MKRAAVLVAALVTACTDSAAPPPARTAPEDDLIRQLVVVDPFGIEISPARVPSLRVSVDGQFIGPNARGEFLFQARPAPYTVSVRFVPLVDELDDRRSTYILNFVGLTARSPRVAIRRAVVAKESATARVALKNADGTVYRSTGGVAARYMLIFESRDVDAAYFGENQESPDADGSIVFAATAFRRKTAGMRQRLHVLESREGNARNVPSSIVAVGSSSSEGEVEGELTSIVMKPVATNAILLPNFVGAASTPSSVHVLVRPPNFGFSRLPPSTQLPGLIAIAPEESGLQTTVVGEATLPNGGIGRAWSVNVDPLTTTQVDLPIPNEIVALAPPNGKIGVTLNDTFEWTGGKPDGVYKVTALCASTAEDTMPATGFNLANAGVIVETYVTGTRTAIRDVTAHACQWNVQTIDAPSVDAIASADGWQTRLLEESKLFSGSTSISATQHFNDR